MKHINKVWRSGVLSFVIVITGMFTSCELQRNFEYVSSNPTADLHMTAWEYISSHDSLEMFEQAIDWCEMDNYFHDDSVRTFIAPTNVAFTSYLSDNGYSSIDEVPVPILRNVIKYHIVNAKVTFTDPDLSPSNNPIAYTTENGQIMYLSHDGNYRGLVNQDTQNSWSIITSNLAPTNGIIHVLPSVVHFSEEAGDSSAPIDSTGADNLILASNKGFSLESGESFVLNTTVLEITGAFAENIIYVIEEIPANGWLINGATILKQGDKFTQMDIDVMNLVYVNDGNSSDDQISLSAMDIVGSIMNTFNVDINIL